MIDSLEALWNRYNVQIQYYEEALTKLMQMPVKERILYSFYLENMSNKKEMSTWISPFTYE